VNDLDLYTTLNAIEQSIKTLRVASGEKNQAIREIKALRKELVALVADQDLKGYSRSRINSILNESEKIIDAFYYAYKNSFNSDLIELSSHTINTIHDEYITIGIPATLPAASAINAVLDDAVIESIPLKAWWEKQNTSFIDKYNSQIKQGIIEGETTAQIIGRIKDIAQIQERQIAALVQTSVMSVMNKSRETYYKNNGISTGYKQLSTLDSHTSLVCISYSGAKWDLDYKPLDNGPPYNGGCPRHVNCRSTIVDLKPSMFPDLDTGKLKEIRTRASEFGQVGKNVTFDDFLNMKDKAGQDVLLGKGRADLWRAGKITLKDLVDQNGRPLTIKELVNGN
jgi:SPP1 gp7 family putative phage head morphogenesis protein